MYKEKQHKEVNTDHDMSYVNEVVEKFNKHFRLSDYQVYKEIKNEKFKETEGHAKSSFIWGVTMET